MNGNTSYVKMMERLRAPGRRYNVYSLDALLPSGWKNTTTYGFKMGGKLIAVLCLAWFCGLCTIGVVRAVSFSKRSVFCGFLSRIQNLDAAANRCTRMCMLSQSIQSN